MKKLMIALIAVAAATAVNAAAITWASDAMKLASGADAAGTAAQATGYLWVVDPGTYGKYSSYSTGAELTKAIMADYVGEIAKGSYSVMKDSVKKSGAANLIDPTNYSEGGTAYAIILYKDNTAVDTYMGNIGTYTFDSAADWEVAGMSKFIGGGTSGTATAWQAAAVPEPTSGLLLLLGIAGLALKRRRA